MPSSEALRRSCGDLPHDDEGNSQFRWAFLVEIIFEIGAFNILEGHVAEALLVADSVNLHDVWMRKLSDGLGFSFKPFEESFVLSEIAAEQFDGYPPLQGKLLSKVNLSHAAFPQASFESKVSQQLAGMILLDEDTGRSLR